MVVTSSQGRLFHSYHYRLLPPSSSSPPSSLSRSWPQSQPWAWGEEGELGGSRRRKKNQIVGLRAHCAPLQQQQQDQSQTHQRHQQGEQGVGIMCELCNGRGWLLCDFCKGQKTNVKAENNRIYRRCPSCRAIGYVLCSKCKVFKCVTFPDYGDGEM